MTIKARRILGRRLASNSRARLAKEEIMSRHALLHLAAVVLLALVLLIAVRLHSAAAATTIDPHALYERACSACHPPHSRDLAAGSLVRIDGRTLSAKSGKPVADLLMRHMGVKLSAEE
ncbi:MAG: hypothetical protein HXY24_17055, partial [Rubrivivax sp.]|nr:hypothetical protein [Rubrivivax sp.]